MSNVTTKSVAAIHSVAYSLDHQLYAVVSAAVDGVAVHSTFTPISSRAELLGYVADAVLHCRNRVDQGLILYVSDATIRDIIASEPSLFPGLELRSIVTGDRLVETWKQCRRAQNRSIHSVRSQTERWMLARTEDGSTTKENTSKKEHALPHAIVATDASKGTYSDTVGISAVCAEGWLRTSTITSNSIQEGEFAAVSMALERWHTQVASFDVLTDSEYVYKVLNGIVRTDHLGSRKEFRQQRHCIRVVKELQEQGISVRVHWVRSHNGHPLNEIADRAAVTVRRCVHWNLYPRPALKGVRADLADLVGLVDPASLMPDDQCQDFRASLEPCSAA